MIIITRIKQPVFFSSLPILLFSFTVTVLLLGALWFSHWKKNRSVALFSGILLSAGFGFFAVFTAVSTTGLILRTSFSGMKPSMVQAARVRLITDPRAVSKGGWVAEGRLEYLRGESLETPGRGRVVIFGRKDSSGLAEGRIAELQGVLKSRDLRSGGAVFTFSCRDFVPVGWRSEFHRLRYEISSGMYHRLTGLLPETASFLAALLLGWKTDSASSLAELFRLSGCIHILALSGFHVGLIAFVLKKMLKPFIGITAASLLSAFGALGFLLLTGIRPSLFRAVLMYLLWTRDSILGYKIDSLNYLSAAFILQVLIFPLSVYSLSFQLSYTALTGLILSGRAYSRFFSRYIPKKAASVFGAGLGAQFITLPLIVHSFGIWYPVGILAAPLLSLLTAWAMVLGSLSLAFPLKGVIEGFVGIIENTAGLFAAAPSVKISAPASWLIASAGTIIPLILIRSIRREHLSISQSRLPGLYPRFSRQQGSGSQETLGAEFPDQFRGPEKNSGAAGNISGTECMGDRARAGCHECGNTELGRFSQPLRNRSGLLHLAPGISGVPLRKNEAPGRGCDEKMESRMGQAGSGSGSGQSSI